MPKGLTHAQIEILPKLNEVCYEIPIPGQPKKACGNCATWSKDNSCAIHAPDRLVFEWDNCSYHIPGIPKNKRVHLNMAPPLEPEYSGLGYYPHGTNCTSCPHFQKFTDAGVTDGICLRVRQDERVDYARVNANGCCARYAGG